MNNKNLLPLRKGVGVILLNKSNKVFVAQRIDNPVNLWQMPQGGIDKNENTYDAAIRELFEETSITNIQLIKEFDYWLKYELPKHLLGKIWKGKYRGQTQKWFVMKFLGNDSEINLNTKKPEFFNWKWINKENLVNVVVDFKVKVYEKISLELDKLNLS